MRGGARVGRGTISWSMLRWSAGAIRPGRSGAQRA